ncbi:MAG: AraC family transcriptional regulator [Clostridiales bacterium]|nr:AraC family transcriptional regulator [Clostridiales bacterium]
MDWEQAINHEIVVSNPDVDVRFYLSVDPGSYVAPHWHNSLEVVYVLQGWLQYQYNQSTVDVQAGEFLITNSKTVHAVLSGDNRAFVLQIPRAFLQHYVKGIDTLYFSADMHPSEAEACRHLAEMKQLLQEMYNAYCEETRGRLLRFNYLMYQFLYLLVEHCATEVVPANEKLPQKHLKLLTDITYYIRVHYKEKLSTQNIAERFNYHPNYLSRIFKEYMGLTILDYIYTIRIINVQEELRRSDRSIREIFEDCGCSNYNVAVRVFRERYHCTPHEMRRMMKHTPKYVAGEGQMSPEGYTVKEKWENDKLKS